MGYYYTFGSKLFGRAFINVNTLLQRQVRFFDPLVRTVTKEEAERIIKHLMDAGAKRAFKQPVKYNGMRYELPEGGEFGIRTKSSLKSTRYGTQHTIDLEPLKLEIIKLKY